MQDITLYEAFIWAKDLITTHQTQTEIIGFLSLVVIEKSKKIKFNPFSFVGNLLTGDVMQKVYKSQDELKQEINKKIDETNDKSKGRSDKLWNALAKLKDELEFKIDSNNYERARGEIFRFEEGIRRGVIYSQDHWNSMRDLCIRYEKFSDANNRFINSQCEGAIRTILSTWETSPWERSEYESVNK